MNFLRCPNFNKTSYLKNENVSKTKYISLAEHFKFYIALSQGFKKYPGFQKMFLHKKAEDEIGLCSNNSEPSVKL